MHAQTVDTTRPLALFFNFRKWPGYEPKMCPVLAPRVSFNYHKNPPRLIFDLNIGVPRHGAEDGGGGGTSDLYMHGPTHMLAKLIIVGRRAGRL